MEFISYLGLSDNFPATTKLIASDISPDMLELARRQLEDPSIEFQVADACHLKKWGMDFS